MAATAPSKSDFFKTLREAADRGAKKRNETPDAAMGRALGINRAVRRAGRSVTASCLGCGTKIKARNYPRHRAKCAPLRVEEARRDAQRAMREQIEVPS